MSDTATWTLLAGIAMTVGLVGVVVPILPGILLIWAVAVLYGIIVGFGVIGWVAMAVVTALAGISIIKSLIIPRQEAEKSGASTFAQLGGLVGAVIGFFLIPIVGVIVGALVGVLVVEWVAKGDLATAWKATKGVAKGFGKSALIDLVLGLAMIATWSVWAFSAIKAGS